MDDLAYNAVIPTLFHDVPEAKDAYDAWDIPGDPLPHVVFAPREYALRNEPATYFLLPFPGSCCLIPAGYLSLYFAALLLNIATVYGLVSWMFPPSRHLPK
jgi:hypothetical protein